jgi:hypothetical protein
MRPIPCGEKQDGFPCWSEDGGVIPSGSAKRCGCLGHVQPGRKLSVGGGNRSRLLDGLQRSSSTTVSAPGSLLPGFGTASRTALALQLGPCSRVSAGWQHHAMAIEALDVLYVPSRDVQADLNFYRNMLGVRVVFAIDAMGTRVAEVAIGSRGPRLVLAEHLVGDAPVLPHRVSDLDETLAEFGSRRVAAGTPGRVAARPVCDLPKPWRAAAWCVPAHPTRGRRALRWPLRLLMSWARPAVSRPKCECQAGADDLRALDARERAPLPR